jgi:murein DD-endopeptidase MepM/ murein hydrolase activator NlpD
MRNKQLRPAMGLILITIIAIFAIDLACARSVPSGKAPSWQLPDFSGISLTPSPTAFSFLPPTRIPGAPILSPTPDSPHQLPAMRLEPERYVVQPGDTLGIIAQNYSLSVEQIMKANNLTNPDILDVGQKLIIPVPTPESLGPDFKIIPDSELVYGPVSAYFDVDGFVKAQGGYLLGYREKIDDQKYSGVELINLTARNYSINPRLLLALLEYQSQWVTKTNPDKNTLDYPLGWRDPQRKGLYRQLAWAANNLNRGYYLWRVDGVATWVLRDGRVVPIAATINAGTAGIQYFYSQLLNYDDWRTAISPAGLFAAYTRLFGYPFDLAFEPLLPPGLQQPAMQLPFEPGVKWTFTGGPHGGWDNGSAWAALDFAPGNEALGCVQSDKWVVAIANGLITRSEDGIVMQDVDDPNGLPSDGLEQTGWLILYMHVEDRDRIKAGVYLKAGERIGHPSCEGGISTGTHVHIARRYNGEWIPADQSIPFVLDGWISVGTGSEYEGYLEKNNQKVEAEAGNSTKNIITR